LMDPAYFEFSVDAFKDNFKKLISVLEQVRWNLTIICPLGKKLPIQNGSIGYRWINERVLSENVFPRIKHWAYDRNYANTGAQNVVLGALYFFVASNYKKIYVAGVDFSDFKNLYVDEDNRIYVDSTHSYGSDRYYFDEMPEYGVKSFQQILRAYQKMFEQSEEVRQYADYKGIEVVNLSVLSYIDAFPKEKPIAVYGKLRDDD